VITVGRGKTLVIVVLAGVGGFDETRVEKKIEPGVKETELGKMIGIRDLKVTRTEGAIVYFPEGTYNSSTGVANYTSKQLPYILNQLTQLHKASTKKPLYWLNTFFGASLFFFVISVSSNNEN